MDHNGTDNTHHLSMIYGSDCACSVDAIGRYVTSLLRGVLKSVVPLSKLDDIGVGASIGIDFGSVWVILNTIAKSLFSKNSVCSSVSPFSTRCTLTGPILIDCSSVPPLLFPSSTYRILGPLRRLGPRRQS